MRKNGFKQMFFLVRLFLSGSKARSQNSPFWVKKRTKNKTWTTLIGVPEPIFDSEFSVGGILKVGGNSLYPEQLEQCPGL